MKNIRQDILPLIGTTQIQFGCSKHELREKYSGIFIKTVRKYLSVADKFDYFFAYYDKNDTLLAIEFISPCELYYKGIKIFGIDSDECKKLLLLDDENIIVDKYVGFHSLKLQIGIYAPDGIVESVCIGRENYYTE